MDFCYYSLRSVFILDVDIILKQKSPKIRLRHDVFALMRGTQSLRPGFELAMRVGHTDFKD